MAVEHDDITDRELIAHFVARAVETIPEVVAAVWKRRYQDMLIATAHHIECVETDLVTEVRPEHRP